MASILKVDTLTGVTTAGSIAVTGEGNSTTTNLQQGLCKMWYDIDSTGTFELEDSFNVSSASDGGTGNHTVNYTNNTATSRYSIVMGAQNQTDIGFNSRGTSSTDMIIRGGSGGTNIDVDGVFGNLAGDLA